MSETAAVLALVFGIYFGFSAAKRLKERESALFQTFQFLLSLKLSLEYGGKPLGAMLEALFREERFRSYSFLSAALKEIQRGAALPKAWETAAKCEEKMLGAECCALLLRVGAAIGTTDKPGQSELLSRELLRLDELCKNAKQKREHCAVLFRAAGAFAGFAVFILVI